MRGVHARIVLTLLACSAALFGAVSAAGGAGNERPGSRLSKHDKQLLAAQVADGADQTMLIIAAQRGKNTSLVGAIESEGGIVRYRDDSLDYTRARVPTARVNKIAAAAGIEAVELDELLPLPNPQPVAIGDLVAPTIDPPGETTPAENPYLPTRDIGAPQFVAAHPTYDGRGVTIGIVDTGIDLLTPELQTAKRLDGTPVRKIRDWVTFTDPLEDDPTWLIMDTDVTASDDTFTVGPTTFTAPRRSGHFSFATFAEASLGMESQFQGDVNRDGDTSDVFGVLWDGAETVWVDTNQNASFAHERDMRSYKRRFDVGTFGSDDPATPRRESVPFVVQIAKEDRAVNIGIISAGHGTHVAGIAAGKDFFGPPDDPNDPNFDGAAPEAQIVSVRACLFDSMCSEHAMFEGMIYLAKTAKVDAINMSIGDVTALNDGNGIFALLYNRLIERHKVQMFLAAGNNGPGVNTVADPSDTSDVMSVGAYIHADTWLSNHDVVAAKTDGLLPSSSRGPREDGGLKPQILAPGSALSRIPAWQGVPPQLPPGYFILQGTSMAAPQAAGGAALLISGAKQASGIPFGPEELRQAINSSARHLPGYGVIEQGNGLMNVGAAWSILAQKVRPVEIRSSAPVNTVLSGFLATPGSGPGIYEREGWRPGDSGTRSITLTRVTPGKDTYHLSWTGNDGTFGSLPPSVTLRSEVPVSIPISISTATAGVHSALLHVDDPQTPGIDYSVMNTVIAAPDFTASSNFAITQSGSVDRADEATFFFRIPPDTPAFMLTLHGAGGTSSAYLGRARIRRFRPVGTSIDGIGTPTAVGGPMTKTVTKPAPGVWEVAVETSAFTTETTATYFVTGEWQAVTVSPSSFTVDPTTIGTPYSQAFTFTNLSGDFMGHAEGTTLASAFSARPTISAGGLQQMHDIVVPPGSKLISARIGNASDPVADLDLFLFDCTSGSCVPRSQSRGPTSEEAVSWPSPAAGPWRVVVDPDAVPSGSTAYDYLDLVSNPAFGSVAISDPVAPHPNGDVWSATATVTASGAPAASRFLEGIVQVKDGTTVLGEAEIQLKNVGP